MLYKRSLAGCLLLITAFAVGPGAAATLGLAARIGDRHESWLDEVEGLFDCATAAVDQQCLHPSVRERGEPVDDA